MGKYFAAKTNRVKVVTPEMLLISIASLKFLGISVTGFLPLAHITGIAMIKFPKTLTKQRSITSILSSFSPYFAKLW